MVPVIANIGPCLAATEKIIFPATWASPHEFSGAAITGRPAIIFESEPSAFSVEITEKPAILVAPGWVPTGSVVGYGWLTAFADVPGTTNNGIPLVTSGPTADGGAIDGSIPPPLVLVESKAVSIALAPGGETNGSPLSLMAPDCDTSPNKAM